MRFEEYVIILFGQNFKDFQGRVSTLTHHSYTNCWNNLTTVTDNGQICGRYTLYTDYVQTMIYRKPNYCGLVAGWQITIQEITAAAAAAAAGAAGDGKCVSKNPDPVIFSNNTNNYGPILIIFGRKNPQ